MVERSFAHVLERGGTRRTWLRGRENVHKRYLVHIAGYNLGVSMRALFGVGTPREAAAARNPFVFVIQVAEAITPVTPRLRRSASLLRQTLPDQIATFLAVVCIETGTKAILVEG